MTAIADKTMRCASGLIARAPSRFGLGGAIYALGLVHGLALLHRALF